MVGRRDLNGFKMQSRLTKKKKNCRVGMTRLQAVRCCARIRGMRELDSSRLRRRELGGSRLGEGSWQPQTD